MGPIGCRRTLAAACLVLCAAALPPGARAGRAGDVRVRSFELLNEGVSAYNRGLYDEAVEKLRQSASMALSSFRAYYYLGLALNATRQYAEAVEMLGVALDLDPTHLQALIALGDAYLKLGDIGESRAAYARALKLRPGHAPGLDGVARAYEGQAEDDKAIEYYRRSILSDKGFAPAYTHLGDLYLRQDRIEEAVRLLEEAVTIRPDYDMGLNRLAAAYGRLGMTNEAVAAIRKAIELDPTNPYHLETLGWLQFDQRAPSAAEQSFLAALALDARLPESYRGLADLARRRGDYDSALERIDAALALEGLDKSTVERLTGFRERVVRERARFAELEALIDSGDAMPTDYEELAILLAGRGRWGEAAELQRRAPASPEQEERLAYILFQDGRYREAQRIYADLAARLDTVPLELNNGVALALLGDDAGAERAFDAVLEADPSNVAARLYRGNALLRMGRLKDAAASYSAYLDLGGEAESAERVRRILKQIAPEMLPPEPSLLPDAPPPTPPPDREEDSP